MNSVTCDKSNVMAHSSGEFTYVPDVAYAADASDGFRAEDGFKLSFVEYQIPYGLCLTCVN